jgi:ribosome-interacting GTPase 1
MPFEDVLIQLIDTPPITADLLDPHVQGLIRGADLALLMVDMGSDDGIEQLQELLDRLQQTKTRLARRTSLDEHDVGLSHTATLLVLNKLDDPEFEDRRQLLAEFCPTDFEQHCVSALRGDNLEPLKQRIFTLLDVVRVYTKSPNQKQPDYEKPFTIRRGGTMLEVAELIHKDIASAFKHARVWGDHVHDGTIVKGDYVVHDKDVVEIHA